MTGQIATSEIAWERRGTISIANGATTVTGVGTLFSLMVSARDALFVNGAQGPLEIKTVVSDTELELEEPFNQAAVDDSEYLIQRGYSWNLAAHLAVKQSALLEKWRGLQGVYMGETPPDGGLEGDVFFNISDTQDIRVRYFTQGAWGNEVTLRGAAGDMSGSNNLSELTDVNAARSNLRLDHRYETSGSNDLNWKKIADITIANETYACAAFKVIAHNPDSNYGHATNYERHSFTVSAQRSDGAFNGLDSGVVEGTVEGYVRLVKTATGVYELQVKQFANWKKVTFDVMCTVKSPVATVTYINAAPNGSTTGDIYTVSNPDAYHGFDQMRGNYPAKGSLVIGDNAVGEILVPNHGGLVFIGSQISIEYPQLPESCFCAYDTGGSLSMLPIFQGSQVVLVNDASGYTGTSGQDDRITIGCGPGKIIIQNRKGSAKTFHYTFLGHAA